VESLAGGVPVAEVPPVDVPVHLTGDPVARRVGTEEEAAVIIRKPNRVERKHPKKARQRGTNTVYPRPIAMRLHQKRWGQLR
jgi:hypothetical protein